MPDQIDKPTGRWLYYTFWIFAALVFGYGFGIAEMYVSYGLKAANRQPDWTIFSHLFVDPFVLLLHGSLLTVYGFLLSELYGVPAILLALILGTALEGRLRPRLGK